MLIILILVFVAIILNYKRLGFMKNRFTLILAVLSIAWWIFLVVGQLRIKLDCAPSDAFCNEGNTVNGDLVWGSTWAIVSLFFVWAPYILICNFLDNRKNNKKSKP